MKKTTKNATAVATSNQTYKINGRWPSHYDNSASEFSYTTFSNFSRAMDKLFQDAPQEKRYIIRSVIRPEIARRFINRSYGIQDYLQFIYNTILYACGNNEKDVKSLRVVGLDTDDGGYKFSAYLKLKTAE